MASEAGKNEQLGSPKRKWERPQHLQQPRIWLRENGIVVRDATPDFYPFVLDHMSENYLRDEPVFQAVGALDDPLCVEENRKLMEDGLLQCISLVAVEEGTPGANLETVDSENPPVVIGVNTLIVSLKSDSDSPPFPDDFFKSPAMKLAMDTFILCGTMVNAYEKYGVDRYLMGTGLSVLPSWRCKGVGQLIVKARDVMCKEMDIPLTKTCFTAIQSQKVALKNGFELLGELLYEDMKTPDGQPLLPKMHPDQKKIQLMAKRII